MLRLRAKLKRVDAYCREGDRSLLRKNCIEAVFHLANACEYFGAGGIGSDAELHRSNSVDGIYGLLTDLDAAVNPPCVATKRTSLLPPTQR